MTIASFIFLTFDLIFRSFVWNVMSQLLIQRKSQLITTMIVFIPNFMTLVKKISLTGKTISDW